MSDCILLDYDGTITYRDTTRSLVFELLKIRPLRFIGLIGPLFTLIISKRDNNSLQRAKDKVIGYLLEGLEESDIILLLNQLKKRIEPLFRAKLLDVISSHNKKNNLILVVTASPTFLVENCLESLPVTVLGTDYKKNNGIYSGKIKGLSCFGINKVSKIKEWTSKSNFKHEFIEAWSDSFSDIHMLRIAKRRYWIGKVQKESLFKKADPDGTFIADS